jgi:hypothetical protein
MNIMLELPLYETKLPIQNKTIEFNPLIVKEEKIIAAAKDTGKKEDSFRTFLKILESKINFPVSKLCETDLIHCILELRKRSIGETVKVSFICPHSKKSIAIELNCDDIKVKGASKNKQIKDSGYAIKIRVPAKRSNLWSAIEYIETASEKISFDDISDEQKEEFLDSLPVKIKNTIEENCKDLIHYEHSIEYISEGITRTLNIRSAEDFFTLLFVM